ncbi:MAG: 50S ribosomal protein L17 [Vicingaceae bacterium]|nr:50S ribosomal protein L17 [Vicingaceae bacterium]
MRHGKKVNHLSRQAPHRKAMLANMACSLIEHKRINTTVAKAKALQKYIEPLITKSKTDSTHSRRTVFSYLKSKESVTELFREVSTKVMDRPGGYTRILKTGFRLGDNAQMCFIELVDYNENMLKDSKSKKATSKRRRGGSKKTDEKIVSAVETKVEDVAVVEEPKAEKVVETKVEDVVVVEEPKAEETIIVEDAKVEEPKAEDTEDTQEAANSNDESTNEDTEEEKKD